MSATQTVLVVLGRTGDPATISPWPNQKRGVTKRQYLGHGEREAMKRRQTAIWRAAYIDNTWRLKEMLPKTPEVVSESEIPF